MAVDPIKAGCPPPPPALDGLWDPWEGCGTPGGGGGGLQTPIKAVGPRSPLRCLFVRARDSNL